VSKLDAFKSYIVTYINHFGVYDYVAFAWLILLFFVAILLAIFIAKKSPAFSVLMVILSLAILFAGPFIIKIYLDKYIRPTQNTTLLIKKLKFSDALVVTGEVKNISKNSYSICTVNVDVIKNSASDIQNIINQLKPLRKQTIFVKEPLEVNATKEIRLIFDNYTYVKDVNVSISSECY